MRGIYFNLDFKQEVDFHPEGTVSCVLSHHRHKKVGTENIDAGIGNPIPKEIAEWWQTKKQTNYEQITTTKEQKAVSGLTSKVGSQYLYGLYLAMEEKENEIPDKNLWIMEWESVTQATWMGWVDE